MKLLSLIYSNYQTLRKKGNKFFNRIFGSFILISVVSLTVSYFLYDNFLGLLEKEIGKSRLQQIVQISDHIDFIMSGIDKKMLQFINEYYNEDYYSYALSEKKSSEQLLKLRKLFDSMQNFIYTESSISSMYLYNRKYNYVMSSEAVLSTDVDFFDKPWINNDLNSQSGLFITPLRITEQRQVTGEIKKDQVVSVIRKVPLNSINYDGAMIVNIQESTLKKMIDKLDVDSGEAVYIIDRGGNLISSSGESNEEVAKLEYIKKLDTSMDNDYFNCNIAGEFYLMSYHASKFNDWKYVVMIPVKIIKERLNYIRYFSIGLIVLFFIGSLVIAYVMSRKIYNPIKSIVQKLNVNENDTQNSEGRDELFFINSAIQKLIDDGKNVDSYLENSRYLIKRNYGIALITGNTDPGKLKEMEDFLQIDYQSTCFSVLAMSIQDINEYDIANDQEKKYILRSFIINTCEDTGGKFGYACAFLTDESKGAIILNINSGYTENNKYNTDFILEYASEIQSSLGKYYHLSVNIGIGGIYSGSASIHKSYKEAIDALHVSLTEGNNQVILYSDIKNSLGYAYPYETITALQGNIKCGKIEEVKNILNKISSEVTSNEGITLSYEVFLYKTVTIEILKGAILDGVPLNTLTGSPKEIMDEIYLWDDVILLKDKIYSVSLALVTYYSDLQNIKESEQVNRILSYISNNYNNEISISTVADQFGMSYSNIRKIFSERIKKSLPDYLHELRINKAKELLSNTQLSILDISNKVGYNNISSFNRLFKKYTGITQGEFRKQYQNNIIGND